MNKKTFVFIAASGAALTAAVLISLRCAKKTKQKKRLTVVANAGYETAYDIHFPLRHNKPGKSFAP